MITIGHRGAAGLEPENTLLSFKRALELQVDMIEFDVQMCKSGELVVFHDETLERTTNGKGFVSETSLTELKQLDAGKGECIPTLTESLGIIGSKTKINIELKGKSTGTASSRIVKQFVDQGVIRLESIFVSSFLFDELAIFKKEIPSVRIGLLFEELPLNIDQLITEFQAYSVNLDCRFLTKKIINRIHSFHVKVFAYTVNLQQDKMTMRAIGVDGIFTDFP